MAKIMLFENDNFGGRPAFVATSDVANLHPFGFGDKVSSLVVIKGTWTLFDDRDYKGTRRTVSDSQGPDGDGVYPSPVDWGGANDRMSSIRRDSE